MSSRAISFTFKTFTGTAWVEIEDPHFGIEASGVQLSTNSDKGLTISGLTISHKRVTVMAPAAVDNATVKVFLVSEKDIPRFVGGNMSLPSGASLTISVDNGPSETVSAGATWSINTG